MNAPLTRPIPARLLLPLLGLLAALVGGCTADPSDKDIEVISLAKMREITGGKHASKTMIVDPRAEQDFNAGHIPGAQNYGINSEKAKNGSGLNPVFKGHKYIIVYGENPSPGPAIAMSKRLVKEGADGVVLFKGGLIEWRRAGLPVEKTAGATTAAASAEKPAAATGGSPK